MDYPICISEKLTPEAAYCMGSIVFQPKQFFIGEEEVWLCSVVHNPRMATANELETHFEMLSAIAKKTSGTVYRKVQMKEYGWYKNKRDVFAIVFRTDKPIPRSELIQKTKQIIAGADQSIVRAFLVGAFDGRSSWDKANYFTLDAPAETEDLMRQALNVFGIRFKPNYKRARKNAAQTPREIQFRIKRNDAIVFWREIGLISQARLRTFSAYSTVSPNVVIDETLLPALKTLHNFQFSTNARKFEKTKEEKRDDIAIEVSFEQALVDCNLTEFGSEPSETVDEPKPRGNPQIDPGGKSKYPRSETVAKKALRDACYKCEVNPKHTTFIRKRDGLPYTEPHHLVPMSYQESFDKSLDVASNVVSLCSNCHNQLHYGKDVEEILHQLYYSRRARLVNTEIYLSIDQLDAMYRIKKQSKNKKEPKK